MPMSVQLRRDPFARMTLMRSTTYPINNQCKCCGQTKRTLYLYWWEDDNHHGGPHKNSGPFCGVQCYEAYNR